MITENLSTLKIHKLTQAQYDRELAAGNIDENALYMTPDESVDLSEYAKTTEVEAMIDGLDEDYASQTEFNTLNTKTTALENSMTWGTL